MESKKSLSERIRAALDAKRKRGEQLGYLPNLTEKGRKMGPEYIKIYARTNANNVKASSIIKALKNSGWTYQKIADELNKSGFTTRQGSMFFPTQVRRLYLRTMEDDDKK